MKNNDKIKNLIDNLKDEKPKMCRTCCKYFIKKDLSFHSGIYSAINQNVSYQCKECYDKYHTKEEKENWYIDRDPIRKKILNWLKKVFT